MYVSPIFGRRLNPPQLDIIIIRNVWEIGLNYIPLYRRHIIQSPLHSDVHRVHIPTKLQ